MSDSKATPGTGGPEQDADTGPDTDQILQEETTDDDGKPLDNPSG